MQVFGWQTLMRNESEEEKLSLCGGSPNHDEGWGAPSTDFSSADERFAYEHACWDPKDGELCLDRVKPGETLVEARSDTNVQIVRLIWV